MRKAFAALMIVIGCTWAIWFGFTAAHAAIAPECPPGTHFVFNPQTGQGRCERNTARWLLEHLRERLG